MQNEFEKQRRDFEPSLPEGYEKRDTASPEYQEERIEQEPVQENKEVVREYLEKKAEEMIKKAVILNEDFKNVVRRGRTETIRSKLAGSTDKVLSLWRTPRTY